MAATTLRQIPQRFPFPQRNHYHHLSALSEPSSLPPLTTSSTPLASLKSAIHAEFDLDRIAKFFQSATALLCFNARGPSSPLPSRSSHAPATPTSSSASLIPASPNLTDHPNDPRLLSFLASSLFPVHSTTWDPSSTDPRSPDVFPCHYLPQI